MKEELLMIRYTTILVFLVTFIWLPQAYAGKLTNALANLVEKEWTDDVERMNNGEIHYLVSVTRDVADEIDENSDRNWREHIEDTWGANDSETRHHISKCPYCQGAANKIAQRTGLRAPRNNIPKCFFINGRPYGAGNWGELYPLHPQTGQVAGAAEGSIWFQNGNYLGVSHFGQAFQARSC